MVSLYTLHIDSYHRPEGAGEALAELLEAPVLEDSTLP